MPFLKTLVAAVENERWRPGIGDPTVVGWVTVFAYLLAAAAAARAAWREPSLEGTPRLKTRPSRFWLTIFGLLLALGINKQLDLQSLLTQSGRDLFKAWGMYQVRRGYQITFIILVFITCLAALAGFIWAARRRLARRGLAIAGMVFILGYVSIRASSFHNVDILLSSRLGAMKWNWIFELSGIATVAWAAGRVALAPAARSPRPPGAVTYRYRINPQ